MQRNDWKFKQKAAIPLNKIKMQEIKYSGLSKLKWIIFLKPTVKLLEMLDEILIDTAFVAWISWYEGQANDQIGALTKLEYMNLSYVFSLASYNLR